MSALAVEFGRWVSHGWVPVVWVSLVVILAAVVSSPEGDAEPEPEVLPNVHDLCMVLGCGEPWATDTHGWRECDVHAATRAA